MTCQQTVVNICTATLNTVDGYIEGLWALHVQMLQTKENDSCIYVVYAVLTKLLYKKHVIMKNEIIPRFLEFHVGGDDELYIKP